MCMNLKEHPQMKINQEEILRIPQDHILRVLRWTPMERGSKGRPKTTWRRSIIAELSDVGLTMGEAQGIAQDRNMCRHDNVAYVPHRDEEDK